MWLHRSMGEVKYVAVYAEETFICLMALGGEAKKVFLASCSISQYTYSPHQPINISAFWTLNCDVMDEIYTEQLCSYSIICNKFTCKDDVMLFFCYWRCTEKGQLHNLQWQKPSWEGSYIVCHLQTFADVSRLFLPSVSFRCLKMVPRWGQNFFSSSGKFCHDCPPFPMSSFWC